MQQDPNELLVLGNGPSLRDYEFSDFARWKTLGMNAAYRYWDRIDWRPTFYSCLDDELIETHKDAILRLIKEGRIEHFFLTARILEHYPELTSEPRVRYLDEFVLHWNRARGERFGLRYNANLAFETNSPSMLTTGAYSIRFAAMMGFNTIRLLGVDLTYQPLEQARTAGGTRLVMDSTPDDNPNYFFSDYQKEGDRFNVANPEAHGRELHLHAFIALRDDFIANKVSARILNANPQSKLFLEAVLPYSQLAATANPPPATAPKAILLRVSSADRFENVFRLWSEPAFFPILGARETSFVDLIIESPPEQLKKLEKRLTILSKRHPALRQSFRDVYLRRFESQVEDQTESGNVMYRIDEDTAPICCDWLGRLIATEQNDDLTITLDNLPCSLDHLVDLRTKAPQSLFLRTQDMNNRINSLRGSGGANSLERLLSTPSGNHDDGGESEDQNRRRFFSNKSPRRA